MDYTSVKKHLANYSILGKRKSTVSHAFASALAPADEYEESAVFSKLLALGQGDLDHLHCVYCGELAETWDHLVNLVLEGNLQGYGHQLGNLVPCCKTCNSVKGKKTYEEFVNNHLIACEEWKKLLVARLSRHIGSAKSIDAAMTHLKPQSAKAFTRFKKLRLEVFNLMKEADECIALVKRNKK